MYWRAVHKYTLEDQITAQHLGLHLALQAASYRAYGGSLWCHGEMLPPSRFAEWPQWPEHFPKGEEKSQLPHKDTQTLLTKFHLETKTQP